MEKEYLSCDLFLDTFDGESLDVIIKKLQDLKQRYKNSHKNLTLDLEYVAHDGWTGRVALRGDLI